jgi:hypothetical protein
MDNLPDNVYFKDRESRNTRINLAQAREYGLDDPRQAMGKTDFDFFADEYAREYFADEQEIIRTGQPLVGKEEKVTWPDGRVTWDSTTKMPLRDSSGSIVGTFGVSRDISERKRAEEERQASLDQLRALTARLQSIREEERKMVAREIHDQLGQVLTAIKIDLSSLVRELPAGEQRPARRAASILKLMDESIQTVRRISTELRPGILDDLGLVATLEWAGEDFQTRTGTTCHLDLPREDILVDPECATTIFRIFQETLTNVARHAGASLVEVRLAAENGDLTLEVRDNGKGMPAGKPAKGGSLGILGMRERAVLLGGELSISGLPGYGTTVAVRIPVAHRSQKEYDRD